MRKMLLFFKEMGPDEKLTFLLGQLRAFLYWKPPSVKMIIKYHMSHDIKTDNICRTDQIHEHPAVLCLSEGLIFS